MSNLKFAVVEHTVSSFTKSMGIIDKREEELRDILFESIIEGGRISETLERLSENSHTPEEFAFLCFTYGAIHKDMRRAMDGNPEDRIKSIFGISAN